MPCIIQTRTVIITKCIGCTWSKNLVNVIFDKDLFCLGTKFVNLINPNCKITFVTLRPNGVIEWYLHTENFDLDKKMLNHYFKIIPYSLSSILQGINKEKYEKETELLWNELGSLNDPTLEQIDLYIEELNKRQC